jgi:hypothetical protein
VIARVSSLLPSRGGASSEVRRGLTSATGSACGSCTRIRSAASSTSCVSRRSRYDPFRSNSSTCWNVGRLVVGNLFGRIPAKSLSGATAPALSSSACSRMRTVRPASILRATEAHEETL